MMISDLEHLVVVSETRNSEEFSEIKGGAFGMFPWSPSPFYANPYPSRSIKVESKASAIALGVDVFTIFNSFNYLWTF